VVDKILQVAQNPNTKFYALQILDEAVNTRWQILPEDQKHGIRNFIISLVMKFSEDETIM
jgi:exportin-1